MNNGIGFFGLLAIVFIGLKLGEVGAVALWSWWWVLSPLWAPVAIALGLIGLSHLLELMDKWLKRL
mgnify:CR=1 FL=1|jgi:hypothetical protein